MASSNAVVVAEITPQTLQELMDRYVAASHFVAPSDRPDFGVWFQHRPVAVQNLIVVDEDANRYDVFCVDGHVAPLNLYGLCTDYIRTLTPKQ